MGPLRRFPCSEKLELELQNQTRDLQVMPGFMQGYHQDWGKCPPSVEIDPIYAK